MTEDRSYDIALGEIINGITDPISKRIVSAYKHNVSHAINMSKINNSNFSYAELEKCGIALNVKQPDPLNPVRKLFGTKKIAADRIILKIESHFEQKCDECSENYRNKFGDDTSPMQCFLCLQGSHNCTAMAEKIGDHNTDAVNKPAGSVWLCRGCRLKNDPYEKRKRAVQFQTAGNDDTTNDTADATQQAEDDDEEEDAEDEEDRPSPRRDEPGNSRKKVCLLYSKNQCPHGATGKIKIDGKICSDPHPRKCLKFCRYGNKKGRGCQKARSCPMYHPILCKFSVRHGECRNRECTFTHLRHTKRPASQSDDYEVQYTRQSALPPHPSFNYNRDFPPLQPRHRIDSYTSIASSQKSQNEYFRTPFAQKPQNQSNKGSKSTAQNDTKIDFLVKLIENMKSSIDKDISEIRSRLPTTAPEPQRLLYHYPMENPNNAPPILAPQLVHHHQQQQAYPPQAATMYPWNAQFNPSSIS